MRLRKDTLIILLFGLLTLLVCAFCAGIEFGRNQTADRLCSKQQYDFCEVKSVTTTTYAIKDSFIK